MDVNSLYLVSEIPTQALSTVALGPLGISNMIF